MTPAIALTGFGMQEDVERAQKAGFEAHLTKPVNLQKLEATMWRLLQDRPRVVATASQDKTIRPREVKPFTRVNRRKP